MRSGWGILLLMVVGLSGTAWSSTNGIKTRKRGIVRLQSVNPFYPAGCTSAVVGVRPLVLLTAFHCLGDMETGSVVANIEQEAEDLKRDPAQYLSTRVVIPAQIRELAAFQTMDTAIAEYKNATKASEDPEAALAATSRFTTRYAYMRDTLNRAVSQSKASDLALIVFDKYEGFLNQRHVEDLIERGALVPIARRRVEVGDRVAFGGFGLSEDSEPSENQMHGFTNYVRKAENGFIATFGIVPSGFRDESDTPSLVPPGEMGAILPGDSGGPLMSDYGVVGVASWYKRIPMEVTEEPAPGWSRQADGFYLYLTSRYSGLTSEYAQRMLEEAAEAQHLNLVFSDREIPKLYDVPKWEKVGTAPESRLAQLLQTVERYDRQSNPGVNPIAE